MRRPDLRITSGDAGTLYVRPVPGTRLGARFDLYRAVCRQCGFEWDGRTAQRGPGTQLLRIMEALKEAGFRVELGPDIVARLGKHLADADEAGRWAEEQLAAIEATGWVWREYQRVDVRFMALASFQYGGGINANQQRTGKTPELLALVRRPGAIVITLLAGVRVWREHAERLLPWATPTVLQHRREFRWPRPGEILIFHYDALPALSVEGGGGPYVNQMHHECPRELLLVYDEAHLLKNPGTRRARRADALTDAVLAAGGWAWEGTGTPSPNRPRAELYHMLDRVRLAKKLWGDQASFRRELDFGPDGVGGELAKVMVRRLRRHVMDQIPLVTVEPIELELPPAGHDDEVRFLDEMWEKVKAMGLDQNPDELLRQLRFNPEFGNYSAIRRALAVAKIPAMMSVVEEFEEAGEPLVVISVHKSPVEELGRRPGWGGITGDTPPKQRDALVEKFRRGEIRLAFTAKTGGMAIDLSRWGEIPCCTALVVDRSWVPGDNAQAEDRIVNLQEPEPLTYKQMRWIHPLEEHVEDVLDGKMFEIERVIDSVATLCADPERGLTAIRSLYTEARAAWDQEGVVVELPAEEKLELELMGLAGLIPKGLMGGDAGVGGAQAQADPYQELEEDLEKLTTCSMVNVGLSIKPSEPAHYDVEPAAPRVLLRSGSGPADQDAAARGDGGLVEQEGEAPGAGCPPRLREFEIYSKTVDDRKPKRQKEKKRMDLQFNPPDVAAMKEALAPDPTPSGGLNLTGLGAIAAAADASSGMPKLPQIGEGLPGMGGLQAPDFAGMSAAAASVGAPEEPAKKTRGKKTQPTEVTDEVVNGALDQAAGKLGIENLQLGSSPALVPAGNAPSNGPTLTPAQTAGIAEAVAAYQDLKSKLPGIVEAALKTSLAPVLAEVSGLKTQIAQLSGQVGGAFNGQSELLTKVSAQLNYVHGVVEKMRQGVPVPTPSGATPNFGQLGKDLEEQVLLVLPDIPTPASSLAKQTCEFLAQQCEQKGQKLWFNEEHVVKFLVERGAADADQACSKQIYLDHLKRSDPAAAQAYFDKLMARLKG